MHIQENVSLRDYSTMRLGGTARYLADITNASEIPEVIQWAKAQKLPTIMIGGGSNIIWSDAGFPGLVLVNKIKGYEVISQEAEHLYVRVGAGENWDETVQKLVTTGYSGVEELSLIPGTVGATPIQNVGAYGREVKDVLVSVEAYDQEANKMVHIRGDECGFGYRTSRFKTTDKSRFFITAMTLHLLKQPPQPPFYSALQQYLEQQGATSFSPQVIRDAVIAIRSAKLPDPATVANNGSFFHNPIVSTDQARQLQNEYPGMPLWPTDETHTKLSAAWLVEQAGFKDVHDQETGMATWTTQPLVIVNERANTTADLLRFKQKIVDAVQQKFGILLEQEPELVA